MRRTLLLLPALLLLAGVGSGAAAPPAAPSATPSSGTAPLTVTFLPGIADAAYYQWQFDAPPSGAFSPDFSSDVAESVTYTFQAAGSYVTRLRTYDALTGIATDADLAITVLPPAAPPTVSLSHAPVPVSPGTEVTFTALAVAGPGRRVASYFWDLNADGGADLQSPGGPSASVSRAYSEIGRYPVTVTAVDEAGSASSASVDVKVGLPVPTLLDGPDPVLAGAGVPVAFTAKLEPKKGIWPAASYAWDFGDGQTATSAGPGPSTVTHAYASPGSFTARVTTTDESGHASSATRGIDVVAGPAVRVDAVGSGKTKSPPLYGQAVPAPGRTIVAYHWDFGDGQVLDAPGGPLSAVVHAYGAGTYAIVLTATDDLGGSLVATTSFTAPAQVPKEVFDPPPPPPPLAVEVGVEVDGAAGATARVGHRFVFTARTRSVVGTDGPAYGMLLWDFDGDGLRDRTDYLGGPKELATAAAWQFAAPGNPVVTVRAILLGTGEAHERKLYLRVLPPQAPLECWIVQPRDGAKVWGRAVTLSAKAAPAALAARLDFSVRPEGSAGPWTRVGSVVPPPYSSLSASWNATRFAPGRYELRAEATDVNGPVGYSTALHSVVVEVDPGAPDISEDGVSREEGIDPDGATRSEIAQSIALDFPAYAFGTHARLRIERPTADPHPLESRFQGLNFVPGSFRRLSLVGAGALERPSRITLYSVNPGGVLDGLGVDPAKLSIWQFDSAAGKWVPLYAQLAQPGEDLIRATMSAMGDVGIVADRVARTDDGSSEPVCGALGAEALLLAGLLLRRRKLVRGARAG